MRYNAPYRSNSGYQRGNSYGNMRYNNGNNSSYGRSQSQSSGKRHSDCKKTDATKAGEAKTVITGWKYTKRTGLISFVATAAQSKYQKPNSKYITMVAKVSNQFGEKLVWCQWNPDKKILGFPSLKMVASPGQRYWSFLMPKK